MCSTKDNVFLILNDAEISFVLARLFFNDSYNVSEGLIFSRIFKYLGFDFLIASKSWCILVQRSKILIAMPFFSISDFKGISYQRN